MSRALADAGIVIGPGPGQYTRVRAPVVDTFNYSGKNDEGMELKVALTPTFLGHSAKRMNEDWESTGTLCPMVIGHTKKGLPETQQPPKVGYLHNYAVEPFGSEGKPTLYADHLFQNVVKLPVVVKGSDGEDLVKLEQFTAKEVINNYPYRSGEIWLDGQIFPHSLLGATAPHRNLGLLKLDASGKGCVAYESPGDLKMPKDETPAPDTGAKVTADARLDRIESMLGQLLEAFSAAIGGGGQGGASAPGGGGAAGGHDPELDEFLRSLDAGEEKPEEKPKKPTDSEEKVKLAKAEAERDTAMLKLARAEVVAELQTIKDKYLVDVDPGDEKLVQSYLLLPPEVRETMYIQLRKNGKGKPPGDGSGGLDAAVTQAAADAAAEAEKNRKGLKKIETAADRSAVVKLAQQKGGGIEAFAAAAKELGFTIVP